MRDSAARACDAQAPGSPRGGNWSEPALLQPRGLPFAPPIGRASGAAEAWLAGPDSQGPAPATCTELSARWPDVEPRQEWSNWYRGGFAFSGMQCPLSRSSAGEQECQKVACAEAEEWESATDCPSLFSRAESHPSLGKEDTRLQSRTPHPSRSQLVPSPLRLEQSLKRGCTVPRGKL